jgi:hypothetical protein
MTITEAELENDLHNDLRFAATEAISISRNGKTIANLTNPDQDRLTIAESLFGSVPATMTLEEAREERLDGRDCAASCPLESPRCI